MIDAGPENDSNGDGKNASSTPSQEAYCYFSRQDTVGRGILSVFTDPSRASSKRQCELLVRFPAKTKDDRGVTTFRRLPNMMRVYEAIEQQLLEPEVNKVVVRWYDPSCEQATTSVEEGSDNQEAIVSEEHPVIATAPETGVFMSRITSAEPPTAVENTDESILKYSDLAECLAKHDEEEQKKSKRKITKSSTSDIVRQMLMKSKAKGDPKRIKMEERFFLELVTVHESICETSLVYLGKKDTLNRILRDCVKSSISAKYKEGEKNAEFIVPLQTHDSGGVSDANFQRLDDLEMTFEEAEAAQLLLPFGRLVLQFFPC